MKTGHSFATLPRSKKWRSFRKVAVFLPPKIIKFFDSKIVECLLGWEKKIARASDTVTTQASSTHSIPGKVEETLTQTWAVVVLPLLWVGTTAQILGCRCTMRYCKPRNQPQDWGELPQTHTAPSCKKLQSDTPALERCLLPNRRKVI